MTNLEKTLSVTSWGSYADVLDGGPLFIFRPNDTTGRWRTLAGRGVAKLTQTALAVSSEYSWTRQVVSETTSLLWRTIYDGDSMSGFSGSVLCLGRLSNQTAQAVDFRNFQVPLKATFVVNDHRVPLSSQEHNYIKAGFYFP